MALKGPAGTPIVLEHTSKILKDNPLGDPHVRKLAVWLPPQYDEVGKSSGGYGAILHGMKYAKYWARSQPRRSPRCTKD